ncbi:hypothetical protein D9M71_770660 [compost metagenome]
MQVRAVDLLAIRIAMGWAGQIQSGQNRRLARTRLKGVFLQQNPATRNVQTELLSPV